jgi:glucose-6-phosphate 1-epimerase
MKDPSSQTLAELQTNFAIADRLRFDLHPSGLIVGQAAFEGGEGQFFLHGAHVTHFQPARSSHPLLFMSKESLFADDKPIRGGIPICFPWFGPSSNPGEPAHGWARLTNWRVASTNATDDSVTIALETAHPPFHLGYRIRFGRDLTTELMVTNQSDLEVTCEVALHTYFAIGDIHAVCVEGSLEELPFLDQLTGQMHPATREAIRFTEETDRVYQGNAPTILLVDDLWNRTIEITSAGSRSTVVWNPWIAKSQRMADFGDDEYRSMVCIETANVKEHRIVLSPNGASTTRVTLRLR